MVLWKDPYQFNTVPTKNLTSLSPFQYSYRNKYLKRKKKVLTSFTIVHCIFVFFSILILFNFILEFCFCKRKLYFPRVSIQFLFPFSLPSLPHPFLSLDSLPYLFIFLISNSLSSNLLTCSPHTIAFSPASASLTSFPKVVVPLI